MERADKAYIPQIKRLVLSAMLMAIGFVLPYFTGQIPQIGNLLLPMHIPVFLCGMLCGGHYGAAVGALLPLLRSFILGMPPIYPNALAMSVELAVYGFVAGVVYNKVRSQNIRVVYISLVIAMLTGRLAWGITELLLFSFIGDAFTWQMFAAGAFVNAIPGILIQLVIIPSIMAVLNKTGLVPYKTKQEG